MTAHVTGGCRCGAVRYALALDRLPAIYCCHCTDCQRGSGSAFAEQAFLPASVMIVTGQAASYSFMNAAEGTSTQYACPTCRTRLWNANDARPGFVTIRAGTFDRSREIDPCAHIWVESKQPWVTLPDTVPQFARMEPLADFLAALADGVR